MIVIPRLEVIWCDTDDARDLHYRVRYHVFCEQTGFEDAGAFPDGRERDEHDAHAVHFLVVDRFTRRCIGAMRLIPATCDRLPMESICRYPIPELEDARRRSIELSRLSVLSNEGRGAELVFPRLPEAPAFLTSSAAGLPVGEKRHEVVVRMVWATIAWARQNDVDYVYGIVTAALARVLRRLGVPAVAVGTEVRHRGVRRPYRYDVNETARSMIEAFPNAEHIFHDERPFAPFSGLTETRRRQMADTAPAPSERELDLQMLGMLNQRVAGHRT